jgi:hypothetical protein
MIMQVHDELVFEVPEGEVDWLRTEIPRLMAGVAELKVPCWPKWAWGRTGTRRIEAGTSPAPGCGLFLLRPCLLPSPTS